MGPAENAEDQFHYLNLSAYSWVANIRSLIEEWFSTYPAEHQPHLKVRFRDSDQHESAYFELFTYTLYRKLGFNVTVEPKAIKGRPDFLVASDDWGPFYVEATVLSGKSDQEAKMDKKFKEIQDHINKIESPYFYVAVTRIRATKQQPSLGKFRIAVQDYVKSAERSIISGDLSVYREENLIVDDWELRVGLIFKNMKGSPTVRTIGMVPSTDVYHEGSIIKSIQKSIGSKASKYRRLGSPYLVAIYLPNMASVSTMMDAIYGRGSDRFIDGSWPGMNSRSGEAVFRWYGNIQHRNMSAILGFTGMHKEYIPSEVYVCPNPWARYPLPQPLPRLSRFDLANDRFVPVAGDSIRGILGLPTPPA